MISNNAEAKDLAFTALLILTRGVMKIAPSAKHVRNHADFQTMVKISVLQNNGVFRFQETPYLHARSFFCLVDPSGPP
jgi:hypothetical protein